MTRTALLAAILALAGASPPATTCDTARRCVTTDGTEIQSVCVTRGVVRTCTHYRDGHPVRHCVRTAGRNRCQPVRSGVPNGPSLHTEWPVGWGPHKVLA